MTQRRRRGLLSSCTEALELVTVMEEQIDANSLLSTSTRYSNLFQMFGATLGYLNDILDDLDDCDLTTLLNDILKLFYGEFGSTNANLCQTEYVVV